MTLANEEKQALIFYRLKQADESAEAAQLLMANNKTAAAINRIYYTIFYCVLALALKFGFKTSKHLQLIGWFNKTFIKTGIIDQDFGRIFRDSYEYRKKADYDSFVEFEKIDITILFDEMKNFVTTIKQFIEKN